MISVLCVRRDSIYYDFPVDCWDIERDAFGFNGPGPVIAHPPCRLWGRMSQRVKADEFTTCREIMLGIRCALAVRKFGGCLEHPAGSALWRACNLPAPGESRGLEFTVKVPQWWFGHRAYKETWVYVSGLRRSDLPSPPFKLFSGVADREVEQMGRAERERTPAEFAIWLLQICRGIAPFDLESDLASRGGRREQRKETAP